MKGLGKISGPFFIPTVLALSRYPPAGRAGIGSGGSNCPPKTGGQLRPEASKKFSG